ncbi:MAG: DUF2199 domain-containing protein [Shimia sp.]|uniref:DUF2199 domain-containing protein n=1 Tax=Shimia sp. TaxID=1954381 RepID=UPI00405A4248
MDKNWASPLDGQSFGGVFDVGYDHPDVWPYGELRDSGKAELQIGEDKLSSDLCRFGDHRFIHAVLPLKIKGSVEVFNFGPWASVMPDDFYRYIDYATGEQADFVPCSAWLMNDLPGFDSDEPIACELRAGPDGQQPQVFAQGGTLKTAQVDGISFDQLLDIYAATGTDVGQHLKG